jgi:predicted DNA-binding protein
MMRRSQINLRFPDELTLKIDRLGKRFGVNRTDIFKAMAEHITEEQLDLMLKVKQPEQPELPEPPQAQPLKTAVVQKSQVAYQRPLRSALKSGVK